VQNQQHLVGLKWIRFNRSEKFIRTSSHNSFYALFKITKRLREDLKRYYRPGLAVNVKMVGEQLDEIEMALADYISLIEYEYSKRKEAFS
jgi:hypothetical protein